MKKEKPDATLGYTVKPVVYGAIAAKFAGVKNINSMVTGGGYTFTATTLKARVLGFIVRCFIVWDFSLQTMLFFKTKMTAKSFA